MTCNSLFFLFCFNVFLCVRGCDKSLLVHETFDPYLTHWDQSVVSTGLMQIIKHEKCGLSFTLSGLFSM